MKGELIELNWMSLHRDLIYECLSRGRTTVEWLLEWFLLLQWRLYTWHIHPSSIAKSVNGISKEQLSKIVALWLEARSSSTRLQWGRRRWVTWTTITAFRKSSCNNYLISGYTISYVAPQHTSKLYYKFRFEGPWAVFNPLKVGFFQKPPDSRKTPHDRSYNQGEDKASHPIYHERKRNYNLSFRRVGPFEYWCSN